MKVNCQLFIYTSVDLRRYVLTSVDTSVDLRRYLDIFNVMAYDYHGAFDPFTGHVSPLYLSPLDLLPEHEDYQYFSAVSYSY